MKLYNALSLLLIIACNSVMATTDKRDPLEITTLADFKKAMDERKPTVIFFYASWCGACKVMKERYSDLAQHFKNDINMLKINVDNERLKEAIDTFGIGAIPTFIIKKVGVIEEEQFKKALETLVPKKIIKNIAKQAPVATKKLVAFQKQVAEPKNKQGVLKKGSSKQKKR